ncbi:hypothetical protein LAZ40_10995 [Cereibacter sphaeroides]|uniref:hypothetical protein n=1 Tax=Cereibacter sphaeroides TaxID=1063 RepID=UPI001F39286A|nr:hypothetical protein [Cereibacter sphaeroides]MCE6959582.1 hypothetical protein [Cereibacter sphaeroides]MCE6974558.1 hypothetical protein [Cereibacter sphaeroides]
MATRGQMVNRLAEIFGVPPAVVDVRDRKLSEAGLRTPSPRGRAAADMTAWDLAVVALGLAFRLGVRETVDLVSSAVDLPLSQSVGEDPGLLVEGGRFGASVAGLLEWVGAETAGEVFDMRIAMARIDGVPGVSGATIHLQHDSGFCRIDYGRGTNMDALGRGVDAPGGCSVTIIPRSGIERIASLLRDRPDATAGVAPGTAPCFGLSLPEMTDPVEPLPKL